MGTSQHPAVLSQSRPKRLVGQQAHQRILQWLDGHCGYKARVGLRNLTASADLVGDDNRNRRRHCFNDGDPEILRV